MRALLLPSVSLCCIAAGAQDTITQRFSIGAHGTAAYCHRTLLNGDGSVNYDLVIDLANDIEEPRISWAAGVDLRYALSGRWSLGSGIEYAELGLRTKEFSGFIAVDPIEDDPAIP